ncbi:uncharacterized protein [Montipora capricornis]|uniref:uncharacterized protein isoform X1 n=1 Tax=Montipora capricornis TaxID=246305 RepID=UPI0035F180A7
MTQDSIRAFITENFGKDYYPAYHGQSNILFPLALIVRRKRKWWKRPFGKAEMILLASLENYVEKNHWKLFQNVCLSKLKKENKRLEKMEVVEVSSGLDVSIGGFDSGEVELKTNDTPGDLELGELTEEYFLDPDLRDLLSAAPLNPDQMKPLEGQHLLLVTDVVYSSKFVLAGNRMHQTTVSGNFHAPEMSSWLGKNAWITGHVTSTKVLPPMVNRNSRAPFLFKFCRVVYDKDKKRLDIKDGEFVGKSFRSLAPKQPDYDEAVLNLEIVESLSHDPIILMDDDCERLENIKELLRTEQAGLQRKSLVLTYLQWFEKILTEELTQLFLENDRPLTRSDCDFLRKLGIRARPRQRFLRVGSASKTAIHEYGILLKLLSELSDDQWKEFEATMDDTNEINSQAASA